LKNSDLVLLNEYYEKLKFLEYKYQKKTKLMKNKELIVTIIFYLIYLETRI